MRNRDEQARKDHAWERRRKRAIVLAHLAAGGVRPVCRHCGKVLAPHFEYSSDSIGTEPIAIAGWGYGGDWHSADVGGRFHSLVCAWLWAEARVRGEVSP